MEKKDKIVRVIILGQVQGVGYRNWTVNQATALGLRGWVRNLTDGTVEAVFCGPEATVNTMLTACRQGPVAAKVTDIHEKPYNGTVSRHFVYLETKEPEEGDNS